MNKETYKIITLLSMFVLAGIIQANALLNGDVGYLLYATQQFHHGGQYGIDIFETNPPMILYLYTPVWWLVKLTSFNVLVCLRAYMFLLIAVSLSMTASLLHQVINATNPYLKLMLLYTVAFVLLFLPIGAFGQREHLFVILTMPYIFLAVLRTENVTVSRCFSLVIGLAAGLGFSLKPFFIAPLLLIELFLFLRAAKKRDVLTYFLRIELIACILVMVLYVLSVYVFHPSYFKKLLPLVLELYFVGSAKPWLAIIVNPIVVICLLTASFYFCFYDKKKYLNLMTVLQLSLIGMLIAFLIPRSDWFYHVMPALSYSCILLVMYVGMGFVSFRKDNALTFAQIILFAGVGLAFVTPQVVIALVLLLLSVAMGQSKNFFGMLLLAIMLAFVFARLDMLAANNWMVYLLAGLSLVVIYHQFNVESARQEASLFLKKFLVVSWCLLMFLLPLYGVFLGVSKMLLRNNPVVTELVAYVKKTPSITSINCFSAVTTQDCFPLVYMTDKTYASRYSLFWWLGGVIKLEKQNLMSERTRRENNYLIDLVADDLNENHTSLILINMTYSRVRDTHQSLLDYFLKNENFRSAWSHYHYSGRIKNYDLYTRT